MPVFLMEMNIKMLETAMIFYYMQFHSIHETNWMTKLKGAHLKFTLFAYKQDYYNQNAHADDAECSTDTWMSQNISHHIIYHVVSMT